MINNNYRIEKDSLGEIKVPLKAYWGAQTQRAIQNFPVSGLRFPRPFIRALGMLKYSACMANMELSLLEKHLGKVILEASKEVIEGKLDSHFPLDIFQTGSGTSTNMNANEVIANRANQLLGEKLGSKKPVHPNDHVNMGQSSNDVIPTCIHISATEEIENVLLPNLEKLKKVLEKKSKEFDRVVKVGRTHYQDATPIRLGQEFSGYAVMIEHGIKRIKNAEKNLSELALGGTAVGTGINTHPNFASLAIARINELTSLHFMEAKNHFEAQGSRDAVVETSSSLKVVSISMMKIANDIRFMSSGPRCGIGEIILPEVQPGSSIMPGKINPVIPEAVCQVTAQIIGNDTAISLCGMGGHLELNLMMPLMAYNLLQSIRLLSSASVIFAERCISGIKPDHKRIRQMIDKSIALCTVLSPIIGYDVAAKIAEEAYKSGKTVYEIVSEKKLFSEEELQKIFDPVKMTENKWSGDKTC